MGSTIPPLLTALLIGLLWPERAAAHLVQSGFGPFYDGVAHFVLTPEDVLAAIALTLLAGLRGKPATRLALLALPAAWLAGAAAGWATRGETAIPILSAALLIALGAAVAWDRLRSPWFVAGFCLAVGLAQGFFNGAALVGASTGGLALAGIVFAVFVVVTLLGGQVVTLEKAWMRVAVRVAGSWIGAIGMLLLGWALRVRGAGG